MSIRSEDVAVAMEAMNILQCLAKSDEARTLSSPTVLPILQQMLKDSNETIRLRVYEVAVNVANASEANLAK